MTWKKAVPSRDEQFRLKKEALLREAARAFSAHGYHNTSLDDIAKGLGVTKAALYYYVKSKQDILYECHSRAIDIGEEALAYGQKNGGNGREKVALLLSRYITSLTSALGSFAVLREYSALESAQRTAIRKRRDGFEHAFIQLVEEGIRDGSLRGVHPKMAVFFVMGAINWMTQWYRDQGELPGEEVSAQFTDIFMHGMVVRP